MTRRHSGRMLVAAESRRLRTAAVPLSPGQPDGRRSSPVKTTVPFCGVRSTVRTVSPRRSRSGRPRRDRIATRTTAPLCHDRSISEPERRTDPSARREAYDGRSAPGYWLLVLLARRGTDGPLAVVRRHEGRRRSRRREVIAQRGHAALSAADVDPPRSAPTTTLMKTVDWRRSTNRYLASSRIALRLQSRRRRASRSGDCRP